MLKIGQNILKVNIQLNLRIKLKDFRGLIVLNLIFLPTHVPSVM